jgi:CubicO group peptidase (beta-lactamase class C family)
MIDFTAWRALTADWAGGGFNSTLENLNRFLRALAHGEVFGKPSTREAVFTWRTSKENVSYGLGVIRIDLDRGDDAAVHGMGEIWGHIGASSCFMFYWPKADASFCGTFNQVACENAIIPFVSGAMGLVQPR